MCLAWCHGGKNVRVHAYTPGPVEGAGAASAAHRTTPVQRIYTSRTLSSEIPEELIEQIQTDRLIDAVQLGEGGYGTVFKWHAPSSGKDYAIKKIEIDPVYGTEKWRGDYECAALRDIRSPYCVEGFGYERTRNNLYVVMECVQGRELLGVIRRGALREMTDIRDVAAQVVVALEAAHKKGYIYRDLKPENIMFVSARPVKIKLIDFGFARRASTEEALSALPSSLLVSSAGGPPPLVRADTVLGTPEYFHRSVLRLHEVRSRGDVVTEDMKYGPEVDFWALGVLICEMLTRGQTPFAARIPNFEKLRPDRQLRRLYAEIEKDPTITFDPTFPRDAADLIRRLVSNDPARRITNWEDVKAHPFFRGMDFAALTSAARVHL